MLGSFFALFAARNPPGPFGGVLPTGFNFGIPPANKSPRPGGPPPPSPFLLPKLLELTEFERLGLEPEEERLLLLFAVKKT